VEQADHRAHRSTCKPTLRERFSEKLRAALAAPGTDLSSVAVAVADKTRLCGYAEFLPVLLEELLAAGATLERITFYIAYGTHHAQAVEESRQVYGPMFDQARFIHHDCTDSTAMAGLGRTTRGTDVIVRRDFAESTCRITFGAISHHYFAGYGGGRKLVFPGLAARDAVYSNHSLYVDAEAGRPAAACQPGRLTGNPVAEDLREIADLIPTTLAIHGIVAPSGRVRDLLVGTTWDDFEEACRCHALTTEVEIDHDYDIVIASCGGYPKDVNFIQAHKSLHHAAMFAREGGTILLFAECRDGIGSETFMPWFAMGGFPQACKVLAGAYAGNGGTALATMDKAGRFNIQLVTSLPAGTCRRLGITAHPFPGSDRTDLARFIAPEALNDSSIAVLPNASLTVKRR